ncbi:MAG: hypothetical protein JNM27_13465 [Leptospirales bacterium]|nr:hypothetical protein [Leptospirales bacterium]
MSKEKSQIETGVDFSLVLSILENVADKTKDAAAGMQELELVFEAALQRLALPINHLNAMELGEIMICQMYPGSVASEAIVSWNRFVNSSNDDRESHDLARGVSVFLSALSTTEKSHKLVVAAQMLDRYLIEQNIISDEFTFIPL